MSGVIFEFEFKNSRVGSRVLSEIPFWMTIYVTELLLLGELQN
jgi:hypothetical protein